MDAAERRRLLRRFVIEDTAARVGVTLTPELWACLGPEPKEMIVSGGQQAGKSVAGAFRKLILLLFAQFGRAHLPGFEVPAPGQDVRWVVLPSYSDPNWEMHYLDEWLVKLELRGESHFPQGASATITIPSIEGLVESKTAQDLMAISGTSCRSLLVVEAGRAPQFLRSQAQARTLIHAGPIDYVGTLEDDEGHPALAWYANLVSEWREKPTWEHAAVSLPTWANPVFQPLGRQDPRIVQLERDTEPQIFSRRYAGEPSGVWNAVYGDLVIDAFWLKPVPLDRRDWLPGMAVGGHDFGEGIGHPCTLAAVTVNSRDEAWVREVRENMGSSSEWIEGNLRELSAKYGIRLVKPVGPADTRLSRWALDPMQREAAKLLGAQVAPSATRLARVAKVNARITRNALFWDAEGPGVPQAYAQAKRVHFKKSFVAGEDERFEYVRHDDDMMAAVEDAIDLLDKMQTLDFSAFKDLSRVRAPRVVEAIR